MCNEIHSDNTSSQTAVTVQNKALAKRAFSMTRVVD
jgi:hypothetical protein